MSDSEPLSPRHQAERVALFRAEFIGAVSRRALSRDATERDCEKRAGRPARIVRAASATAAT